MYINAQIKLYINIMQTFTYSVPIPVIGATTTIDVVPNTITIVEVFVVSALFNPLFPTPVMEYSSGTRNQRQETFTYMY